MTPDRCPTRDRPRGLDSCGDARHAAVKDRGPCHRCDCPLVDLVWWGDGWEPLGDGCEGGDLCSGPAIDWRARALKAEASHATQVRLTSESRRHAAEQRREIARLSGLVTTLRAEATRARLAGDARVREVWERDASEIARLRGVIREAHALLDGIRADGWRVDTLTASLRHAEGVIAALRRATP